MAKSKQEQHIYMRSDLAAMPGLHISSVDRLVAKGILPKPQHLGQKMTFWPCSQIDAIIERMALPEVDMTDAQNPATA